MKYLPLLLITIFLFSCGGSGSSGSSEWPAATQAEYMQGCESEMDYSLPADYCDCTLEKAMKMYPDFNDMLDMDMSDMLELAEACL
jgi:hypothetical protein